MPPNPPQLLERVHDLAVGEFRSLPYGGGLPLPLSLGSRSEQSCLGFYGNDKQRNIKWK